MRDCRAVRNPYSLLATCRTPEIAAEVPITAAERLGVDAAIIFADLLLPFTPMGLDFEFLAGEGPQVNTPIRTYEQVAALRTDRIDELSYVARSIEKVATHFSVPRPHGDQLGIIRFCRPPFPHPTHPPQRVQPLAVPVIYFGPDTASLLPAMRETGADVLGLDWRIPLDIGWRSIGHTRGVQGNLDPITLFAPEAVLHARVKEVLDAAAGRPGHIFNLGHGIVPGTPVENVIAVVNQIKQR